MAPLTNKLCSTPGYVDLAVRIFVHIPAGIRSEDSAARKQLVAHQHTQNLHGVQHKLLTVTGDHCTAEFADAAGLQV